MLKVLLVVVVFAAATYGLIRAIERRGIAPSTRRTPPPKPREPREQRPVGPDDDEEFLRDLDRRRLPEDPDSGP